MGCNLIAQEIPKNIIIFIGDGMGVSQLSAAKYDRGNLNIERCKVAGLVTTAAADKLITDSAAGATAYATGHKTSNGAISMSTNGKELKTLFEFAEERGKSTGVVATSTITHATPAAFTTHIDDRGRQDEIARQMAEGGTDVIIGGGRQYFIPQSIEGSERNDDIDPIALLKNKMPVVNDIQSLHKSLISNKLAALLELGPLPKASEREYSLAGLTKTALEILKKEENGFVLLVEGSQIDWGGHENNLRYILSETIDFDEAVGAGLDFAERDGETLVVVTADHETGGLSITGGTKEGKELEAGFNTGGHTADMVPIFSYGPSADEFSGILDNTDIGKKLINFLLNSENIHQKAAN